jgi:hypothetical protein
LTKEMNAYGRDHHGDSTDDQISASDAIHGIPDSFIG